MATSCSNDESSSDNGGEVLVKAAIYCRGAAQTRATTYLYDVDSQYELIKDWWIVVVDHSTQKIVNIITRADNTYVVEKEAFEFRINAGTYDIYSFANITKTTVEGLSGVGTLSVGGDMPDINAVEYGINSVIANGLDVSSNTNYIPMTGKEINVVFSGSGLQTREFEVIRMVAKLEFIFKNGSQKDITLKHIKFNPVNTGNILLMPNYTTLGYNAEKDPVLLAGTDFIRDGETPNFLKSLGETVLEAETYENEAKWYTSKFYLRESLAASYTANPTKHFLINLGIERSGASEEILYSITNKTTTISPGKEEFTGINRNDYVQIPIKFSDYVVDLKVNFYPPIGGYPAVITKNLDESEFYCTFATQGDFQIRPRVKNTATGLYLPFDGYDFEITETTKMEGADIFDTGSGGIIPYIDGSYEILGRMTTGQGTYKISINVTVEVSPGVFQIYPRNIYIIRKNVS